MKPVPDHTDLQRQLILHLRKRVTKARVVVGEVALTGGWGDHGRLDVVALELAPYYRSFTITGFEVKATRQDLRADIAAGKWDRYTEQVHRLAFAIPTHLEAEALDALPTRVGIITTPDQGSSWSWRRPAKRHGGSQADTDQLGTLLRIAQAAQREPTPTRAERVRSYRRTEDTTRWLAGAARAELLEARNLEAKLETARMSLAADRQLLADDIAAAADLRATLELAHRLLGHIAGIIPNTSSWHRSRREAAATRAKVAELAQSLGLVTP